MMVSLRRNSSSLLQFSVNQLDASLQSLQLDGVRLLVQPPLLVSLVVAPSGPDVRPVDGFCPPDFQPYSRKSSPSAAWPTVRELLRFDGDVELLDNLVSYHQTSGQQSRLQSARRPVVVRPCPLRLYSMTTRRRSIGICPHIKFASYTHRK